MQREQLCASQSAGGAEEAEDDEEEGEGAGEAILAVAAVQCGGAERRVAE